jgi:hypothetical protein
MKNEATVDTAVAAPSIDRPFPNSVAAMSAQSGANLATTTNVRVDGYRSYELGCSKEPVPANVRMTVFASFGPRHRSIDATLCLSVDQARALAAALLGHAAYAEGK